MTLLREMVIPSEIIYSDYQATLANGAEIDSGWIDMGSVDKLQFTEKSDTIGLTFETYSRADVAQTPLSTSTIRDASFSLANTAVRQRYMRFKVVNNTGGVVNEVSLELKASYGSSDKLSVFPLKDQPTAFSQAGLMQSVNIGQDPSGSYVSAQVNEAGAALVAAFGTEVARGLYTGYAIRNHFGHNHDIDTGSSPEDIIHGGGTYTGFNAIANENIEVFSASANDAGSVASSGTATGGSATTLVDTGATFVTDSIAVGDVVLNDSQGYHGFVTVIDSETQLTVFRMNDGAGIVHTNASGDTYRVVKSTSTGAAVIRLESLLDVNDDEQTPAYVVMNGTTGVIATGNYFRCSRVRVIHSGSLDVNAGEITVRQETTTANIFALMDTVGRSEMALDTVPRGKTAIIKDVRASIVRASGGAGSGNIILFSREKGGSWNAREVFGIQTGANVDQSFVGGLVLEAGTDFKLTVQDVSDNNTEADGSFEYFLIDE